MTDDPEATVTCGTCVWAQRTGRGGSVLRCLRHRAPSGKSGRRVEVDTVACSSHTVASTLDCQACGACCREAYHRVEVSPRDPFVRTHAHLLDTLVEEGRTVRVLARPGGLCRCLVPDAERGYRCTTYEERPRTCRDFTAGSANCLEARRRVGLTP